MPRIQLEQVTKIFPGQSSCPLTALDQVSLAIDPGEFLVLAGPSGSGKTTLLRLVAGLDQPTRGSVCLDAKPIHAIPPRERPVAMVFQNPALFPEMSVWENLAFGLKVRGCPRAEIQHRVEEAARWLALADCLQRQPGVLSGGERQRVALGRALVRRPSVLLLDEPLSNLDPQLRAQLRALIRDLHRRLHASTVYVTHDRAEALSLGDRLAVLRGGALEQVGPPAAVHDQPATLFMAGFLGARPINLLRGHCACASGRLHFTATSAPIDWWLDPNPGGVQLPALPVGGSEVVLAIRPEWVEVLAAESPKPGWPTLPGVVRSVEPAGPELYVGFAAGPAAWLARAQRSRPLSPGAAVTLQIDPSGLRWFHPGSGRALTPA